MVILDECCYPGGVLLSCRCVVIVVVCCYPGGVLLSWTSLVILEVCGYPGGVVILDECCYPGGVLLSWTSVVILEVCCYPGAVLLSWSCVCLSCSCVVLIAARKTDNLDRGFFFFVFLSSPVGTFSDNCSSTPRPLPSKSLSTRQSLNSLFDTDSVLK